MAKEFVLVQWFSNDSIGCGEIRPRQELRKFNSRTAVVRVVMEELEKAKRRNARMIVEGAQFSYVDIVRMYTARNVPYSWASCSGPRWGPLQRRSNSAWPANTRSSEASNHRAPSPIT